MSRWKNYKTRLLNKLLIIDNILYILYFNPILEITKSNHNHIA